MRDLPTPRLPRRHGLPTPTIGERPTTKHMPWQVKVRAPDVPPLPTVHSGEIEPPPVRLHKSPSSLERLSTAVLTVTKQAWLPWKSYWKLRRQGRRRHDGHDSDDDEPKAAGDDPTLWCQCAVWSLASLSCAAGLAMVLTRVVDDADLALAIAAAFFSAELLILVYVLNRQVSPERTRKQST